MVSTFRKKLLRPSLLKMMPAVTPNLFYRPEYATNYARRELTVTTFLISFIHPTAFNKHFLDSTYIPSKEYAVHLQFVRMILRLCNQAEILTKIFYFQISECRQRRRKKDFLATKKKAEKRGKSHNQALC
jgi:hypothetical protein